MCCNFGVGQQNLWLVRVLKVIEYLITIFLACVTIDHCNIETI